MSSFFFLELQLITVLLSICDSCMSWSARFFSAKVCWGFFIFDSVLFLLKFIFLFNKRYGVFGLHNFFQYYNNREATHTIAPKSLIFIVQQEIWKFNDICMSWNSLTTVQGTNFLNLEHGSIEYVTFSKQ